jgi:hypothetical protein
MFGTTITVTTNLPTWDAPKRWDSKLKPSYAQGRKSHPHVWYHSHMYYLHFFRGGDACVPWPTSLSRTFNSYCKDLHDGCVTLMPQSSYVGWYSFGLRGAVPVY